MDKTTRGRCIQTLLSEGCLSDSCFRELTGIARGAIHSLFQDRLSEAELSDLTQEAVIQAWHKRGQCRDQKTFLGWFFKVAHGCALAYWRSSHNKRKDVALEAPSTAHPDADTAGGRELAAPDNLEANVISSWMAEHMDELLTDALSQEELEIYRLRKDGVSHAAIGEQLGIGENASKKGLQRVKNKALALFDTLPRKLPRNKCDR